MQQTEMTGPATRYLTPLFEVQVIQDVEFGRSLNETGRNESLRLDLYLPADDPAPLRPVILWFRGGGSKPGNDKRQIYIPWFANAFAARGYAGVAPDYRLRTDPTPDLVGAVRDAVEDALMALQWVRAHGQAHRIDAGRIALAGGSAGGMVVLNLIHDAGRPVDKHSDGLFAALDMWGTPGEKGRLFEWTRSSKR